MTRRLPFCCEADAVFLSGMTYEHTEQSVKDVIAKGQNIIESNLIFIEKKEHESKN